MNKNIKRVMSMAVATAIVATPLSSLAANIYVGNVGFNTDKMLDQPTYKIAYENYLIENIGKGVKIDFNEDGKAVKTGDFLASSSNNIAEYDRDNGVTLPSNVTIWDGTGTPGDNSQAELKVESVSAIDETGVTVTLAEMTEAKEGATIKVVDPSGNVVEVNPLNLEIGDTVVTFDFAKAYAELPLGVFTVEGKTFDTAAVDAVAKVNAAGSNVVKLWEALQLKYFTGAVEANIEAYKDAIALKTPETVADVNKMIADVNKAAVGAEEEAAVVKKVADATNALQLLNALKDGGFERVNADWITDYSTQNVTLAGGGATGLLALDDNNYFGVATTGVTIEAIQDAIDAQNATKVGNAVTTAKGGVDKAKVTSARELVNKYIPADVEGVTTKATHLKDLDIQDAIIAVNEANTNAKLTAALNNLVVKVDNSGTIKSEDIHANLIGDYRTALFGKDKETAAKINTEIDNVNKAFDKFVVEDAKVSASATATPKFVIKALRKDGKAFEVDKAASAITVAIGNSGDKAYKVTTSENFTDAPKSELEIEVDSTNFNLPTVGAVVEPVIKFTVDSVVHTVKGKLEVTAGQIDATETLATMELDKADGKYVSGEDVTITFTIKDAAKNVLTTENGTYAATITLDTEKIYKDITFVNGKATVTVPARKATTGAQKVQVELTTKDNGALDITKTTAIEIKAAAFSTLKVAQQTTTSVLDITATDGVNTITDFGTKLVNIKAVKVVGETETPVEVANTDFQGNVSASFSSGVYAHTTSLGAGTYKVTVTVNGVTTTQTITVA